MDSSNRREENHEAKIDIKDDETAGFDNQYQSKSSRKSARNE